MKETANTKNTGTKVITKVVTNVADRKAPSFAMGKDYPPMVSFSKFAIISGIGEYTLRKLINKTSFPHLKVDGLCLIHIASAMRWLEERCLQQCCYHFEED